MSRLLLLVMKLVSLVLNGLRISPPLKISLSFSPSPSPSPSLSFPPSPPPLPLPLPFKECLPFQFSVAVWEVPLEVVVGQAWEVALEVVVGQVWEVVRAVGLVWEVAVGGSFLVG